MPNAAVVKFEDGDRALVIGVGRSGMATAAVLRDRGLAVTAYDDKPSEQLDKQRADLAKLRIGLVGEDGLAAAIQDASIAIVSPGVPPNNPAVLAVQRAGVPARDIGRVLSLQHDALVTRLIDFSLSRHGPAPVAWAWLDLGSAARREFTLSSDQDNALAYAEPGPGSESEIDDYFARLGREVNEGLARCGFGVDDNGVLAGNRLWRMSKAQWLRTFDECLRAPDESRLIRASVAFDFRRQAAFVKFVGAHAEYDRVDALTVSQF